MCSEATAVKISKLNNEQLDYWVAKAQGWYLERPQDNQFINSDGERVVAGMEWPKYWDIPEWLYRPSVDWKQAGELLERYQIAISYPQTPDMSNKNWIAQVRHKKPIRGMTPQQAICMAVIASVYGDEVDD